MEGEGSVLAALLMQFRFCCRFLFLRFCIKIIINFFHSFRFVSVSLYCFVRVCVVWTCV